MVSHYGGFGEYFLLLTQPIYKVTHRNNSNGVSLIQRHPIARASVNSLSTIVMVCHLFSATQSQEQA